MGVNHVVAPDVKRSLNFSSFFLRTARREATDSPHGTRKKTRRQEHGFLQAGYGNSPRKPQEEEENRDMARTRPSDVGARAKPQSGRGEFAVSMFARSASLQANVPVLQTCFASQSTGN
jgi:hypothetical protein